MATVFALSVAPEEDHDDPSSHYQKDSYNYLIECANLDKFGVHSLTGRASSADLVIFAETTGGGQFLEKLRRHPLINAYREKCFLFCEIDNVIPFIPGIYASIERRWYNSQRVRSGHYLRNFGKTYITYDSFTGRQPFLYSFVGSIETASVRREIHGLNDPRGFVLDTSSDKNDVARSRTEASLLDAYHTQFLESMRASKFVLCPRGYGASSMRLFEAMQIGRPPVVLSDQWVPPDGPQWKDFCIRIPERRAASVPQILETYEVEAADMGLRARKTWEEWFSKEVTFHRIVEWCLDIQRSRVLSETLLRHTACVQLLRPRYVRQYLRSNLRRFRSANKSNRV